MFFPVEEWFAAFVLTVVVELPIVVVLLAPAEPAPWRRAAVGLLANVASHPIVWYVLSQLLLVGTTAYVAAAEGWAIAAEAACYAIAVRGITLRRAVAVSVAANAASYLVGQLVHQAMPRGF